jgi:RNA polymerase sigma-70 factor (ECF subfamily)
MHADAEADETLMQAVALDQRAAFETLVRRHAAPLLTFLHRMTGDRHRAEEQFQEVFLAVWTKRQQYQYPRPFRPWLFAIAANQCRADYRRQVRTRESPLTIAEEAAVTAFDPTPPQVAIAAETAATIADAIGDLPMQQRQVVVLRLWNSMSYAEIAAALNRSEATVRSHMHHALAALRKKLDAIL